MTNEEFQKAVERLLCGDKDGLRVIYEAYIKLIYAVVYNTVHNKEDAEDITSEFFVKLIRVAHSYRKGSPHKTWLVTIARNMSIDFIRKKSHEFAASGSADAEDKDMLEDMLFDTPESKLEDRAVLSQDMRAAMETLDAREKEIVDLKIIGGMKFKEIAQILGKPMGTVTWLYNQGIKKLRRCLSDYE